MQLRFLLLFLSVLLVRPAIHSQNVTDTRLLTHPAVGQDRIAFVYAEDLWTADHEGTNPRRLTIDEGVESDPVFSPDGSMIAFSAAYDGNIDVFVVPASGGIPKRLTWHPGADQVQDFTPDGRSVLFNSRRATYTNRHAKLYTVSVEGGQPVELPIPTGYRAAIAPDGKHLAYVPLYEVFNQWKNYRGGTQGRIWIMDLGTKEVTEIPRPANGANDANPQWINNTVYFRSDRNGEFNLFSYNTASGKVSQLTDYEDFPVLSLSAKGNDLLYEQAGYLHRFDPATQRSTKLTIGIATDLLELRPRYVSGEDYIREAGISPSGARAVFDFRGEIVTVPSEKGDVNNLTQTPGAHEQDPQWSPNGKSIAYFSDASGEYALHVRNLQEGSTQTIALAGAGFYAYPHWSPDSKHIAFVDNSRTLYVAQVASGQVTKIDQDHYYLPGAFRESFGSWSPDSKWIAYTRIIETNFEQAYVYSLEEEQSYPLSDGLSNVSEPVFDPSGKFIYMLASTNAGPVVNWFEQSNQDMEMTHSIYLATLQDNLPSPLKKENDIEPTGEEQEDDDDPEEKTIPSVRIDWDDLQQRIISLPVSPGMYSRLSSPSEGQLLYLSNDNGQSTLHMFDMEKREAEPIMPADWYAVAAKGEKILYRQQSSWGIAEVGKKPENGKLKTDAIEVKIDPVAEWKNIFHETWRVNRDYFYDPGMHGADWEAMREKYAVFLPDVSCRGDLYRVMQWMCSELGVGHHRFGSRGDRMREPEIVGGGLLGADYKVDNNRYRFDKIYGGLNWTPDLRAPLTEPGVQVDEGDYLITVDGEIVTAEQNLYRFFENKAGKLVKLTVADNSTGNDARTVDVVPIADESALRNRDWVEGNIRKVDEATNGRVAYVYVPNTAALGHQYFKRYFFPQVDKEAVILDERHNGGGQIADYYIDQLRKPYQSHWNFRYGADLKSPSGSIQGPKVMLIDETAGSGGDLLPWLFRKFEMGPLIGKTTWGGLVGVLGFPEFIDGGSVTAPNVAFYSEDGFRVENEGVAPDIEVEQWPKEVMQGRDPQLEKAIEVIMEQLQEYKPEYPERPDYPVRVNK